MPDDVASIIAELLALPPDRFTAARNDAARQLRVEGRRDDADSIKALARPPLGLWALNRVACEQPALIEGFLAAAERLREAHVHGGDIRAATPPEREAEAQIVAAASDAVAAAGGKPTETVLGHVRNALRAAAAEPDVASLLRAGRLLREPEPPSPLELLGQMRPRAGEAKPAATVTRAPKSELAALRQELRNARAEASRADREARAASAAERGAREAWERAQMEAEDARRRSDAASERVRVLEDRLRGLEARRAT